MLGANLKFLRGRGVTGDRRSVAAMEFALVAPVTLLLLFGVYDIAEAMIIYEEVYSTAHLIPSSASIVAEQGDGSTKLYYSDIQRQESAIWAEIPNLRSGFKDGVKSVTMSSVVFELDPNQAACGSGAAGCFYIPFVAWSATYTGGQSGRNFRTQDAGDVTNGLAVIRHCGMRNGNVTPTLNRNTYLYQSLPLYGPSYRLDIVRTINITTPDPVAAAPDPMLVVDVHLQYTPTFNLFLKTPIDFWANGYWPARSVAASAVNSNGQTQQLTPDQQYTGIVSTGTTTGGVTTYTINGGNVYSAASGQSGTAPAAGTYCISNYYAEPSS